MTELLSSSAILEQADHLARAIIETTPATDVNNLPDGAFMIHRPNTPAESYRHGQGVAWTLQHWQASDTLQAAGLLHSFVCRGLVSATEIAETCGQDVAELCEQYCDTLLLVPEQQWYGKTLVIKRVKLYVAAYRNPALAILGVASLWDHFENARRNHSPELRGSFIEEARQVMLPLLEMLGMWYLKTEVEEWVTRHTMSQQDYANIVSRLNMTEETRWQAFAQVHKTLMPLLPGAEITTKPPLLTHVYKPGHPEKVDPEALNKLTVNVCVDSEGDCYEALRWVNRFWQPVEYKLVDHIGNSKLNGYRCLETTVVITMGSNHIRAHVNIFTDSMSVINQWGLAALELHQRKSGDVPDAWWHHREEGYQRIAAAKLGSLPDILYVFSPQGQLLRFPRGCTVVDYAYQVHSEVAHQTKRFLVNGETAAPSTVMHHLDLVELERDPRFPGPSQVWLNAARTSRARSHIARFLKRQRQEQIDGRAVLDARLQEFGSYYRLDLPWYRVEQKLREVMRRQKFAHMEQLLAEIAAGRVATDPLLHPLFSAEVVRQIELPAESQLRTRQFTLAQCCRPRPGDEIVGRPTIRHERVTRVKVHKASCRSINTQSGTLPLKWRLLPPLNAVARLEIWALSHEALLQDILMQISEYYPELTLHTVNAASRSGITHLSFAVEARDQGILNALEEKLVQLPKHTVNQVRQMQLTFSEREELSTLAQPASYNPYRRQPVQNRDMFFGRVEELSNIRELLRTGAGLVFVQGQKRVGKTSLLLYLKQHYLNRESKLPVLIDMQLLGNLTGSIVFFEIASAVYNDLQADNQINTQIEPPLRELFELDPARQLIDYLEYVHGHFGKVKLIVLIDEFSRLIDAFQQQRIGDTLFHQWRGIVQATIPDISYVMVVQAQSYKNLQQQADQMTLAPIWHLLELGHSITLAPLQRQDACQLISRPTANYLEYTPEALNYVWRLTGGSPFLIQAFCYNLIRYLTHNGKQNVDLTDIETVQTEFMNPNEGVFAHLLHIVHTTSYAADICQQLARLLGHTDGDVPLAILKSGLHHISAEALDSTLKTLTGQHILEKISAGGWRFSSLLFGRWLAINQGTAFKTEPETW